MSTQEATNKRRRLSEFAFAAYASDSDENSPNQSDHDSTGTSASSRSGEQRSLSVKAEEVISKFRKVCDGKARIHGSQAVGLAFEDSDIDLLVEMPLLKLLAQLRQGSCRGFSLVEYVSTARVPRLILKHKASRAILDCIEIEKDPHALAKDVLVQKWLALGSDVVTFAKHVRLWARQYTLDLPRSEGYPNSFLLLLTAFCFLRQQLGASRDERDPASPPHLTDDRIPANLFEGWLVFLRDDAPRLRTLDLRSSIPKLDSRGDSHSKCLCQPWSLLEPVSGHVALSLSGSQAEHLARLTQVSLIGEAFVSRRSS